MRTPRIRLGSAWDMRFEAGGTMSKAWKVLSGLFFLAACTGGAQVRAPGNSVIVKVVVEQAATASVCKTAASRFRDARGAGGWPKGVDHAGHAVPDSAQSQNPPQRARR